MAIQYAGGPITAIAVSNGGSGYTGAPSVSLSGIGSGFGATFTVNLTGGVVTSITVSAGGHAYPISGVTATFTGGTGGSGAVAGAVTVSGGDVNATFSTSTKQNIIDNCETQLLNAGWTTISGHGTTNLLMQCAATPYGTQGRFRFKDNGGQSVQVSVENTAGTITGTNTTAQAGAHLVPGTSKTWRIIANPYQFFLFVPADFTNPRQFCYAGCPFVPALLTGVTNCALVMGDAQSDTENTQRSCWRNTLATNVQNSEANFEVIFNSTLFQNNGNNNSTTAISGVGLVVSVSCALAIVAQVVTSVVMGPWRWANGNIHTSDPLLSWGLSTNGDEPEIRCQLWDCSIVYNSYTGDTTSTFDSHNWFNLTNSNVGVGGQRPQGSVFVVTP